MPKLYHGSRKTPVLHVGICLTPDQVAAVSYIQLGDTSAERIATVQLDWSDLTVEDVADYDRETDTTPADYMVEGWTGADVIEYMDEAPGGYQHRTYRLMTARAVAAARIVAIEDGDGYEEDEDGVPYLTA
jgi:hypothetical protein